jgi:LysR family glycine cleavage system transcriptional activator
MARLPALDLLRTFVLAATHLNVSRTASALFLTPSAISRQLKLLEEQMQVPLFERTNRGLSLTDKGQEFYAQIREPMAQILGATTALMPESERLTLLVDAAFAHTWLVKRLAQFKRHSPGIELDLRLGGSLDNLTGLPLQAGIDVQIVYGSPPWSGFHSEALLQFREFPVCSPTLLQGASPLRSPADLPLHTMIHEGERSTWRRWLRAAKAQQFESEHSIVAHDSLTCLSMAIAGQGVAIGDNLTCADYLESGQLVKPFIQELRLDETFHLVLSKEKDQWDSVQNFRNWLLNVSSPKTGDTQDTQSV